MADIKEAEEKLRSANGHIYELTMLVLICEQAADAHLERLKEGEPDWGTVFSMFRRLLSRIENDIGEVETYINVEWLKAKGLYKAAHTEVKREGRDVGKPDALSRDISEGFVATQ